MKRLTIILTLILLLITSSVYAAGTAPSTWTDLTNDTGVITFSWTADASAATVPATASSRAVDGYVVLVVTDPGSTAPTDNYDITLTDSDGVDIMGCTAAVATCTDGALINRDTANTEQAVPKVITGSSVYGGRWVSGVITLNIANNSNNSATGTVKIYIQR